MTGQAPDETPAPDFSVVSGNPTPTELAAVTAVLTAMLDEAGHADDERAGTETDAWRRSQRGIRAPIRPGTDTWRSFSG
ncbi:MAG TPA: acyl-CoA carboxylase subunit epsilon [Lacisediminihabitans sp.]|uniref:acyl-CoA carboxylase subunit epsilon n=1 Tax=Lacisediminihabitans sp. TaxID=2787631 RepID=UPI002ED9FA43